jgi:glyoxylase-like metal-dependent hydrolase (beta-lactamase superfamily II)
MDPAHSARRAALIRVLVGALVSTLVGACAPRFTSTRDGVATLEPPRVVVSRIELTYSNAFLLTAGGSSRASVLVDAGGPSDVPVTTAALEAIGLHPQDIKVVVLTHGHGDHAGMASFFQKGGARIVVGRGDELQTTVGHNDEMTPTGLFARALKPFVKLDYEPFVPDILVDDQLDLAPLGLPGASVRHMPGHTRGSLVVLVGGREAIVGDQMLGGIWGGAFHGSSAGDHYYQLDPVKNRCNIQALLDQGIERFHLGHGGPANRDSVLAWKKSWPTGECGQSD